MNETPNTDRAHNDPTAQRTDGSRTNTKRRWTIAGLAAGTIGLAGAAWYGHARAHGGPFGRHGWHGPMDPESMGRRIDALVAWALADIDVTPEQRARIAAIAKAAANDLAPLRERHRDARRKSLKLLAAPTIDRAQLEALRVEQMQCGDTATRRMLQALLDAADVLDPGQRALLMQKWRQRRQGRRG